MEDRLKRLDEIVKERDADNPCPACGRDMWWGGNDLATIQRAAEGEPGEMATTGEALPAVMYV